MNKLEELRINKGWSQAELARRSGASNTTISHLESGKHKANLITLTKLARALEVDWEELKELLDTGASKE